ncbi:PREDICTED: uncharacterized protein C16orf78 homolog [Myotis brandtii]|uniref:uncharacterized protein C16orf78 homolog n=1 Tax=Myotis brandtii TaxID=109478 RepID=UPI00070404A2|nr:PREDICTED: uncharacterized protein C16orf78 homolog [Myotis brandtii]
MPAARPSLFPPGGGPTFGATQASHQGQRAPQGEPVPPSVPMQKPGSIMPDKSEDRRDSMPTERKSMWRTAEERRMSDLTRVMEWLERRRGKELSLVQPQPQPQKHTKAPWVPRKAAGKEAKKVKVTVKNEREKGRQVTFSEQGKPGGRRDADPATFRRTDQKGKRQSIVPGNYSKESIGKSEPEMKDSAATEATPRMMSFHHQSMTDSTLQDSIFGGRKSTLLRDWVGKLPDTAYERRLKSLMEKGGEPKVEAMRALRPRRYLRLSKNNIRTLLKLCTDAGLVVDIHPHMVEAEIDAKKVFAPYPTVSL